MKYCNDHSKSISNVNLKKKKENVVCSLQEVENFLCKATKLIKGLKIYSLFK